MRSYIDHKRTFEHPETGVKEEVSIVRDEVYAPPWEELPHNSGDWGTYRFGAWLEEDLKDPGHYYISFPYWRGDSSGSALRFAGQWTLRAEPEFVKQLVQAIQARGWLDNPAAPARR